MGNLKSRVKINPGLSEILESSPDIFAYAESLTFSGIKSPIPGYDVLTHLAKKNSFRRGLTVFFSQKYRYSLTKDQASKKYDIIWIKLTCAQSVKIFCFFYAPGAHHPENERISFYDELRNGYTKYHKNVPIFLMGDSNARLGLFAR